MRSVAAGAPPAEHAGPARQGPVPRDEPVCLLRQARRGGELRAPGARRAARHGSARVALPDDTLRLDQPGRLLRGPVAAREGAAAALAVAAVGRPGGVHDGLRLRVWWQASPALEPD